jgi:hypothetical protein
MKLNDARAAFDARPCRVTAAQFRRAARQAYANDGLTDDQVLMVFEETEDYVRPSAWWLRLVDYGADTVTSPSIRAQHHPR